MHERRLAESHDHYQGHEEHEEDYVELPLVHCSDVVAVDQKGSELHPHACAEHPAEPQHPSVHRGYGQAVGSKPRDECEDNAPPPAVLELIHDKDGEDEVHHNMSIAVVQKHTGEQLIEVLLFVFEEWDIEQEFVHLGGVLKEAVVPARCEEDVLDDEDEQAGQDEQGCQRQKFEVGTYPVSEEVGEGVVRLGHTAGVYVGDLDAHRQVYKVIKLQGVNTLSQNRDCSQNAGPQNLGSAFLSSIPNKNTLQSKSHYLIKQISL